MSHDLDFYLKRLNPILDLETGSMIDEIDRMQMEIDMLRVDKENLQRRIVEASSIVWSIFDKLEGKDV